MKIHLEVFSYFSRTGLGWNGCLGWCLLQDIFWLLLRRLPLIRHLFKVLCGILLLPLLTTAQKWLPKSAVVTWVHCFCSLYTKICNFLLRWLSSPHHGIKRKILKALLLQSMNWKWTHIWPLMYNILNIILLEGLLWSGSEL